MLKLWTWYQNCLEVHPVKTQAVSSGVLWAVGDVAAQCITYSTAHKRRPHLELNSDRGFTLDWKRTAITSLFGIGFVGPVGHFWYEGLDEIIRLRLRLEPKTARFVAAKVAADTILVEPLNLFAFFSYMGIAAGKSMAEVREDVKRDLLPALVFGGGAWPVLQVANFRYVPVRYQLLYVNMFCLLESAFLSWVDQQKDAAWKRWFARSHPPSNREKDDQDR